MPSINSAKRSQEATAAAMYDGLVSGGLTLIPSCAAVYAAMQKPAFRKATNWQSRTALAIMPPLFMFALSSEMKLFHKMEEYKTLDEHNKKVSHWAENQHNNNANTAVGGTQGSTVSTGASINDSPSTSLSSSTLQREMTRYNSSDTKSLEKNLHALYKKSVEDSGVRIVPGDALSIHHKMANFWQENPFKILTAFSIPTVLYIFRGNDQKKHLQLQSKIMHTRVYGQFMVSYLMRFIS